MEPKHNVNDENDDDTKIDNVNVADNGIVFGNAEIYLPYGDKNGVAKGMGRKRDNDGNYIGTKNQNPA
jgi:hypothetical protein